MDLKEWLKDRGMPGSEFARRIKVSPVTVYRWKNALSIPIPSVLAAINELTDGKVEFGKRTFNRKMVSIDKKSNDD